MFNNELNVDEAKKLRVHRYEKAVTIYRKSIAQTLLICLQIYQSHI